MKYSLLVALLSLAVSPVVAGDFAELQVINGQPTFDLYVAGKVHGKLGWSAFALVNKDWAQVYAGPTFAPTSWSEVSANIGLETGGNRYAESLWLGHGPVSMLAIHEHGHSGTWNKITADYKFAKSWTIGYHRQSFLGDGARASYTKGKVTVWGSLLLRNGDLNTVVALKVGG